MLSHKYDDESLYITIPEIFDSPEMYHEFYSLLDKIGQVINSVTGHVRSTSNYYLLGT